MSAIIIVNPPPDNHLHRPLQGTALDSCVELLQQFLGEILAVIQFTQVLNELRARHFPANVLPMQIRVEQHDGAGERMHGVLRVQHVGIRVEKSFAEMHQHAFTLLRLAGQ